MPFDPSGNFTRVMNWQQDRDNGIRILADRHDAEDDNFAAAFNQVFLRGGIVPMTGDLNMGGYNINTIKAGSAAAPSLTWELDPDTGFYQPDPSSIGFSVNGVEHVRLHGSGATLAAVNPVLNFYNADLSARKGYINFLDAPGSFQVVNGFAGPLIFGTSDSERMRIDAAGKVGIGTQAPLEQLHIEGNVANTIGIRVSNLDLAGGGQLAFYGPAGQLSGLIWAGNANYAPYGGSFSMNSNTGGVHTWNRNFTEQMRLSATGQLGIGTTNPFAKLSVANVNGYVLEFHPGADVNVNSILSYDRTAVAYRGLRFDGEHHQWRLGGVNRMVLTDLGRLNVGSVVTEIGYGAAGQFVSYGDGAGFVVRQNSVNDVYGYVASHARANGATYGMQMIFLNSAGSSAGVILSNGSSTTYATSCDEALKENIAPAPATGPLIDAINIVEFDWKDGGGHVRYGLIAQQLDAVMPEVVHAGRTIPAPEEGGQEVVVPWMVDKTDLIPMLIKEIQDLRARLTAGGL